MTISRLSVIVTLLVLFLSCSKKNDNPGTPSTNLEPRLVYLDLDLGSSIFNTEITGSTVSLSRDLPYGTDKVTVSHITLAENNTSSITAGTMLDIAKSPMTITVKNTVSNKEAVYALKLSTKSFASPVARNGLLRTSGNKIVNKDGVQVSFAGNSFFWSNNDWGGERFYNPSVVNWLALDWESTIVRASMGVDESGGYLQDGASNKARLKTVVDAAIAKGLYVLIDWHSHHAEDYQADAVEFFTEMAQTYGKYDNVIYEIYNEPLNIPWGGTLKPYAEAVIAAIRKVDPDNMIIVGTPEWSQRVDLAAADPITSSTNIAYTLHFYTKYHQQWLRDRATAALNKGIPIFITEWGSIGYTQNDPETDKWIEWCKTNKISICNWSVNDKAEEWSIVRPGSSISGVWSDASLTDAGLLTRKIIRAWEN